MRLNGLSPFLLLAGTVLASPAPQGLCPELPKSEEVRQLFTEAREAVDRRDWPVAILRLDRALERYPNSVPLLIELGISYGGIKQWEAAVEAHQGAVELAASCPSAHYNLGVSSDQLEPGRKLGSRHYRAALELDPNYVPALINLASNIGDKNEPEAAGLLERAVKIEPDNSKVHYNLGLIYRNLGATEKAASSLARAVSLEPGFLEARGHYIEVLVSLRAWDKVVEQCRLYLEAAPDTERARYRLGQALLRLDRTEEGQQELETARRLRDRDQAVKHFEMLLYRGVTALREGRLGPAEEALDQAIDSDPRSAVAHMYRGIVRIQIGKVVPGLADLDAAVQLEPSNPRVHHNYGMALMQMGRPGDAEVRFREALKKDPYFSESHNSMGLICAERGETDEALEHFRMASQFDPQYLDPLVNLGITLHSLGRLPEAAVTFRQAIRRFPQSPQPYYGLAQILQDQGRGEEAEEQIRKAQTLLDSRPQDPQKP